MPQGDPIFSHKAPGKLMLSGEYSVLHGALALAWPTRMGQRISVYTTADETLHWRALDSHRNIWLEALFSTDDLLELKVGTQEQAAFVLQLLKQAQQFNPNFEFIGHEVITELEFDRQWGLGSSSTFLVCVAQWAGVDAFELFFSSMKGSGYDVAVGIENKAVAYSLAGKKQQYKSITLTAPDRDKLYFIYLGKKQISSTEVRMQEKKEIAQELINEITQISEELICCDDASHWDELLKKHEEITSIITGKNTIKAERFSEYPHLIKSLGAWGGDFIMVRAYDSDDLNYFKQKGYKVIIPFAEMVLCD